MYDSVLIYSRHHAPQQTASLFFCCKVGRHIAHSSSGERKGARAFRKHMWNASGEWHVASQRSLHYAPIFRLLLKVAVKGTHQCDFLIFGGALAPTIRGLRSLCRLHGQCRHVSASCFGLRLGGVHLCAHSKPERWLCRHAMTSGKAIQDKLTWLVLGGDPAARSHRVEQFTAL